MDTSNPDALRLPTAISAWRDGFAADSGITPVVEHLERDRWRFTVTGGRVVMTYDVRLLQRHRLRSVASVLTVDGEARPLMKSYAALLELLTNPEGDGELPGTPSDSEMTEVAADAAPREVARAASLAARNLPTATDLSVRILRGPRRWWAIVLSNGRVRLRINMRSSLMDIYRPTAPRFTAMVKGKWLLALSVDGVDLTDRAQGRLDTAMSMVAKSLATAPPPSVTGTTAASTTPTGVTVRKQIVLRR